MSEQKQNPDMSIDELLSALVDGELTESETEQLLDSSEPELLERWSRYHLAQAALDKTSGIQQPLNIVANVSAAIEKEPVFSQKPQITEEPITNPFVESFSALVDDETTELELRRILKTDDQAALEKLGRYHLVSNILKKEVSLEKPIDVSGAVSAAIAQDNGVNATTQNTPKSVWANLGRFGIAASVAGALVVGVQFLSTSEPQNIAANNPAPISGEPLLNDESSVRVVGNEPSIKAIDKTQEELDEEAAKNLK